MANPEKALIQQAFDEATSDYQKALSDLIQCQEDLHVAQGRLETAKKVLMNLASEHSGHLVEVHMSITKYINQVVLNGG